MWDLALSRWTIIVRHSLLLKKFLQKFWMVVHHSELTVLQFFRGIVATCRFIPLKTGDHLLKVLLAQITFIEFGSPWKTPTVVCYVYFWVHKHRPNIRAAFVRFWRHLTQHGFICWALLHQLTQFFFEWLLEYAMQFFFTAKCSYKILCIPVALKLKDAPISQYVT